MSKTRKTIIIAAIAIGLGIFYFYQKDTFAQDYNSSVSYSFLVDDYAVSQNSERTNQEVWLISSNVAHDESESCSSGYLTGAFTLSVRDVVTKQEIDSVDLGQLTVSDNGLRVQPATHSGKIAYFVMVQKYGTCNGDVFALYALPRGTDTKIKPVSLGGVSANEVFANKPNGVMFAGGRSGESFLAVDYYDNSQGAHKTDTYTWDGNISFVIN